MQNVMCSKESSSEMWKSKWLGQQSQPSMVDFDHKSTCDLNVS